MIVLLIIDASPAAGTPTVTITGGADASGHNYEWNITHDHAAPLIYVEIPQFRAGWHAPPDGWTGDLTHPRGIGGLDGLFIAQAKSRENGISRGQVARFRLNIGAEGTPRGEGEVLLRFADGSEATVLAEVPVKESAADQNISLIGLGLIFGVFLVVRAIRERRRSETAGHAPSGEATEVP